MDFLLQHETLTQWLVEYGPIALFFLLALEIIALPIPGEPLMIVTGIFLANGELPLVTTCSAAYIGAAVGISISYLLGRTAGSFLVVNYGDRLGLTTPRLNKVTGWFGRFGKWTLILGYFVPGIRHFTGFTAGMTQLNYNQFMLFAYIGALVWVSTFLSLGYFLGEYFTSPL